MVRVLHRDRAPDEAVLLSERMQLRGIIVGHEEVPGQGGGDLEELGVVKLEVAVETLPRPLAGGSIGRIDEEDGVGLICVLPHDLDAVALGHGDAVALRSDGEDALPERLRLPAGREPSSVLPVLNEAGAGRQDPAAVDAVAEYRVKG